MARLKTPRREPGQARGGGGRRGPTNRRRPVEPAQIVATSFWMLAAGAYI
jgi:hypothetical protein